MILKQILYEDKIMINETILFFANPYGFIYQVTNLINGKKYIGQTINREETRWCGSLKTIIWKYKDNKHFIGSIKKYGLENFEVETIDRAMSKEGLDQKEDHYIKKYNTLNHNYGYNLKEGGANGKHIDKTKKKISEANKGEKNGMYGIHRYGKDNPMFGKHLNEETKKRIGDKHRGKKLSKEHKEILLNSNIGRSVSKETRRKISNAKKGKPSPRKGKHLSEEHKRNISKALKGKLKNNVPK